MIFGYLIKWWGGVKNYAYLAYPKKGGGVKTRPTFRNTSHRPISV